MLQLAHTFRANAVSMSIYILVRMPAKGPKIFASANRKLAGVKVPLRTYESEEEDY